MRGILVIPRPVFFAPIFPDVPVPIASGKFIKCKLTIYKQLLTPCALTDNGHFIISSMECHYADAPRLTMRHRFGKLNSLVDFHLGGREKLENSGGGTPASDKYYRQIFDEIHVIAVKVNRIVYLR